MNKNRLSNTLYVEHDICVYDRYHRGSDADINLTPLYLDSSDIESSRKGHELFFRPKLALI